MSDRNKLHEDIKKDINKKASEEAIKANPPKEQGKKGCGCKRNK